MAITLVRAIFRSLSGTFADATLVWLAEESAIHDVATVDERDFAAYRTASGRRLRNRFL